MKTNKKETAVHILEDWLNKCLTDVKLNVFPTSILQKIRRHAKPLRNTNVSATEAYAVQFGGFWLHRGQDQTVLH